MGFKIIRKYYDKNDHHFYVVKENTESYVNIRDYFVTFKKFAKAIKNDFTDADLLDFDFDGVNGKKYDFSKAKISSQAMIKLGIYDDGLFKKLHKYDNCALYMPSQSCDLVPPRVEENFGLEAVFPTKEDYGNDVFYISDMHISNKLVKKYPLSINECEIRDYCNKISHSLNKSMCGRQKFKYVLILGDVSYDMSISKIFYEELSKVIYYAKIIVILGNHELWDMDLYNKCSNVDSMVAEYRKFLATLHIICLHNEFLTIVNGEQKIYNENELNGMTQEKIREACKESSFTVLGGMGFAGLNNEFNCNSEVYGSAVSFREDEIEQSRRFERLYKKLSLAVPDKVLLVATHMPKKDWTNEPYQKKWIYLWGHTHKNYYVEDNGKTIYADNQIGYSGTCLVFKHILTTGNYDTFADYEDGIYEITRSQYIGFYRCSGISISFKRPCKCIYMLKKAGIYCFLVSSTKNEIKLLNGGLYKNIGKHDVNYIYFNLENYAKSIKMYMEHYQNAIKQLSNEIKKIGGNGIIHGCIVDIDFYNHVYLNSIDGTITPYFAYSMTDKYVYNNVPSLLKCKCKELYLNYTKCLEQKHNPNSLKIIGKDIIVSEKNVFDESTEIYRVSRIIKGLQYTTNYNIVRLWNDCIAADASKETGKLLVNDLIYPKEMEEMGKKEKEKVIENRKIEISEIKKTNPKLTQEVVAKKAHI